MATLATRRLYADGDILFGADLDAFLDDVETFINVTKVNDDNIQDAGITGSTKLVDASVTAGKLATDSVTTAKIVDGSVTTAKLADTSVTTAKITDANVTTAKLADTSVTTAKLVDASVTTAKIANAAITQAKRAALGHQVSSSCGSYSTTSSSLTAVTNLSVTITTTGRPVSIFLDRDPAAGTSISRLGQSNSTTANATSYAFFRGSTQLSDTQIEAPTGSSEIPPGAFRVFDDVAAGTYTYTFKVKRDSGDGTVIVQNTVLIAYEL